MGDVFKALADPTRRRILELLAQGELTAGEIAAQFDMTKAVRQPPSEHLKGGRAWSPMSAAARTLSTA